VENIREKCLYDVDFFFVSIYNSDLCEKNMTDSIFSKYNLKQLLLIEYYLLIIEIFSASLQIAM